MSNAYRAVVSAGGGAAVGDATAADVLTGKTFSGAVGSGVSGTMPNNGAVSGVATPSTPYTIPAGYHNGSGTVTASGVEPVAAGHALRVSSASSLGVDYIDISNGISQSVNSVTAYLCNVSDKTAMTCGASSKISHVAAFTSEDFSNPTSLTYSTSNMDISAYKYIMFTLADTTVTFT